MKKTLLSMLAIAAMCGMVSNAKANIDNPAGARAGEIYRWESNNPGEYEQKCNVEDGIIGLFTYYADQADWDSQFFIVFADAVVPAGTEVEISFQYRKSEDSGVVKFNAQGFADPHSYVNNDGWEPLECTTAWQDFSTTITTSGEIRTLGLNCSVGREDGTLYLRNIKVTANFEDVIDMESDADEANIGERPSVHNIKIGELRYRLRLGDGKATLLGYDPNADIDNVTIPTSITVDNYVYQIIGIGDYAFLDCSNLNSVTIPSSVTSIGGNAFRNCNNLTTLNIESNANLSKASLYFTENGIRYHVLSKNQVEVVPDSYSGNVVVPASVAAGNTFSVISVGQAFQDCSGLTSVTIPNSVTSIGSYAFSGCSGLTEVTIGNSVTSIGTYAFYNCTGLTKANFSSIESLCGISFGNSAANPLYYAKHLYINGAEVTNLVIPESVTSIGDYAFYHCTGLTSVTIPNSVTSIGTNAFYNCIGLTEITIPNSVTSIDESAFFHCRGLTSVTIPNSVTSIGDYAFFDCIGLTEITIPNSVTSINNSVFSGCSSLASVTIPNSVTSIGERAFNYCTGLTEVTIPNTVTSIGDDAFRECSGLTSVTIPNSVTEIGENAFYRVKNIVYNGTASGSPWGALTVNGTIDGDFIYADAEKTQLTAYAGNGGNITIPNSVTSIGGSAFFNCIRLTSVTIGNSVTSIGDDAFSGCSGLTSVTIPNSVTSIGELAFFDCSGLTEITIPNSVTSIGRSTFYGCSDLTEITIPNSVTSIGYYAFSDCSGLISITIPNSVTEIGSSAFYGCSGLISITIPNSVTEIGSYAFSGCSALTEITIPNSVTSIGEYAFDCPMASVFCESENTPKGWNTVWYYVVDTVIWGINAKFDENFIYKINNEAKSITASIYKYIGDDTSVAIPEKVTFDGTEYIIDAIESDAFRDCSSLTEVTIPNSVTSIDYGAFINCSGLASVTIGESVSTINGNVFTGCMSLKSITCKSLIPPKCTNNDLLTDNIVNDAKLYMGATLTCPENAKLYRTLQPWCNFGLADSANYGHMVDTIYVVDTVHSIVNSIDTIISIVSKTDTVYVVDTVRSIVNSIDTIISIVSKTDTVFIVSQSPDRFNVKATTTNAKMGIAYGSGLVASGSQTEIVAIERYGYHFTKWSDGNTNNPRFVTVLADCEYKAEFEANNYNVLAEANEMAMGNVEGAASYAYLSRTQLKAVPNAGYQFKAWSDGETANPREVLVFSDTAFTAVFVAAEVTAVSESAADNLQVYAHHNTIIVENATDEIRVYNAMGALVGKDAIHRVRAELQVNGAGVYIVKVGTVAKRVMIND